MINVGLDVGFRYLKVDTGKTPLVESSVLAPYIPGSFSAAFGGHSIVVDYNGKSFIVGDVDQRILIATTDHSRLETDEFMVLALTGLGLALGKGGSVNVVTGLPHNWMIHAAKLREMLAGDHTIDINGKLHKILVSAAEIVPQAFGTIVDQALIINGDGIKVGNGELLSEKTLVVDFGGNTVNWAAMAGKSYDSNLSASEDLGMTRVLDQLREVIRKEHGVDYTIARLDGYVREGAIAIHDASVPVDGLIKPLVEKFLPAILAKTRTLWATGKFSKNLLLTGGGVRWFGPLFGEAYGHPNTIIVGDSQLSNARGMRKYALWLDKTNNW